MWPHEGPPERWCFAPEWARCLWAAKDYKGGVSVWEALDLPYSRGLGRVFTELRGALAMAESSAQDRAHPPK